MVTTLTGEGKTTYFPISVKIDAPADVVWEVFGKNYGSFLSKVPGFSKVSCDFGGKDMPEAGDSRFYTIFGLPGQEKLKLFDDANLKLSYDIPTGPPPSMIRNGGNTWSVASGKEAAASVFEMKLQGDYTWLGWMLGPMIRTFIQWPTVEAMSYTVKHEAELLYKQQQDEAKGTTTDN